jgi:hypothetical protein
VTIVTLVLVLLSAGSDIFEALAPPSVTVILAALGLKETLGPWA